LGRSPVEAPRLGGRRRLWRRWLWLGRGLCARRPRWRRVGCGGLGRGRRRGFSGCLRPSRGRDLSLRGAPTRLLLAGRGSRDGFAPAGGLAAGLAPVVVGGALGVAPLERVAADDARLGWG